MISSSLTPRTLTTIVSLLSIPIPSFCTPPTTLQNITHSPIPINCTSLNLLYPQCYNLLSLTPYLTNYNTTIRLETCPPDQTWSSCFLQQAYSSTFHPATTKYDCSALSNTTNSTNPLCPKPLRDQKDWDPKDFYGAWNIYTVQMFISSWSLALSANTSTRAIYQASLDPRARNSTANTTLTATTVLTTLIEKYGVSHGTDSALINLLQSSPDNSSVQMGSRDLTGRHAREFTAREWQAQLRVRLAQVLSGTMGVFDLWLGMVDQGAFSTTDLESVGELVWRLEGRS